MCQLKIAITEQTLSGKPHLTSRETEVMKLVTEGLTNRQTAVHLQVSIKTVEKHRQSVMKKLDIHEIAGLTRYAVTHGLVFEGEYRKHLQEQLNGMPDSSLFPAKLAPNAQRISNRQAQVLKLIAEGMANKQIASELNVSIKTVSNHRQTMMRRLDIHDIATVTRYAMSQGLLSKHPSAPCLQARQAQPVPGALPEYAME